MIFVDVLFDELEKMIHENGPHEILIHLYGFWYSKVCEGWSNIFNITYIICYKCSFANINIRGLKFAGPPI